MEGFLGEGEVALSCSSPLPLKPLLPRDYPSCAGMDEAGEVPELKGQSSIRVVLGYHNVMCPCPHRVQEGMEPEGWPLLPPANKDEVQAQMA